MKISALLALPASILAAPSPDPALAERASDYCTVTTDGVRYRTCVETSYVAVGQYDKGTTLHLAGSVVGENIGGTMRVFFVFLVIELKIVLVNGEWVLIVRCRIWWRLGNGYYISAYYCS